MMGRYAGVAAWDGPAVSPGRFRKGTIGPLLRLPLPTPQTPASLLVHVAEVYEKPFFSRRERTTKVYLDGMNQAPGVLNYQGNGIRADSDAFGALEGIPQLRVF
ncbi:hypothetical protein FKM82_004868 [Ascaphus truei]